MCMATRTRCQGFVAANSTNATDQMQPSCIDGTTRKAELLPTYRPCPSAHFAEYDL